MSETKVFFWQNMPSIHQAPYIRELAEHFPITVVMERELPEWRRAMGWQEPDFGRAKTYIHLKDQALEKILSSIEPTHIHLFSGMRAYPLVWRAFQSIMMSPARIGLISEPSNWEGISGAGRLLLAKADHLRFGRHIDLILAIGHLAIRWFSMIGYPDARVFPFIYTTETPIPNAGLVNGRRKPQLNGPVNLIFIGQCIRRKGVDLLLEALGSLQSLEWELDIIGDGEERPRLQEQCAHLNIDHRVHFWGNLTNYDAMCKLESGDLLVLPSRWDGWGSVVNEALMRGVSVVCSSRCGAADLLGDPLRGSVFQAGSVSSLRSALQDRISKGKVTSEVSQSITDWSARINGSSIAAYFLQVIESRQRHLPRPIAPWLSQLRT